MNSVECLTLFVTVATFFAFCTDLYKTYLDRTIPEYKREIKCLNKEVNRLEKELSKLNEDYEILSRCKIQQIVKTIKEAEGEIK